MGQEVQRTPCTSTAPILACTRLLNRLWCAHTSEFTDLIAFFAGPESTSFGLICSLVRSSVSACWHSASRAFSIASVFGWNVLAGDGLRMISSAFLHADTTHLAFNMLSLYFFGDALEASLHFGQYAAIALGSLVGGNLLALRMHRKDPSYRAVGASGMVSGLIFSAIILYPEIRIGILFLPFMLPDGSTVCSFWASHSLE